MSTVDLALAQFLTRRHGAFARREAVAVGFTDRMIERRVASGAWRRLHPRVFCLAATRPTPMLRYEAASLAADLAKLSGRTAAHVLAFDGFGPVRPEITVPPTGNARVAGCRVRRRSEVRWFRHNGLPVTTPAQTLLDLTPVLVTARLESLFDSVLLAGLDRAELREIGELARSRTVAGSALFNALVAERIDDVSAADSVLELETARLLRSGGLEPRLRPRFEWWKSGDGRFDCELPHQTLVETDGRAWHARVAAFDEDRWRDAQAAAHGFLVLRFTATHIRHRGDEVLDIVHATLRQRSRAA